MGSHLARLLCLALMRDTVKIADRGGHLKRTLGPRRQGGHDHRTGGRPGLAGGGIDHSTSSAFVRHWFGESCSERERDKARNG